MDFGIGSVTAITAICYLGGMACKATTKVKMSHPEKIPAEVRKRMYFLPINISFIDDSETDFLQKLECDVREN